MKNQTKYTNHQLDGGVDFDQVTPLQAHARHAHSAQSHSAHEYREHQSLRIGGMPQK